MSQEPQKVVFSISPVSVVKVVLVLIAFGFAWFIRDVIALLFASLIIASALDPTIDWMQRYKIPRAVGVILIYVLAFVILSWALVGIAGPIANEVRSLSSEIPRYYSEINSTIEGFFQNSPSIFTDDRIQSFRGGLDSFLVNLTGLASGNVFPVISAFFGGLVSLMLAMVIIFYFIVQEGAVKQFLGWVVPQRHSKKAIEIMEKTQVKLGLWLRGQLLLSLIIFLITYIGLSLLGVKYALVLALLAGLFELIPYLGPILSAVPAIFLTLVAPEWGGLFKSFLVLILYTLIQQAENNFLVPKVMSKTVGLNPLIVIISMLIGAQLAGILGLIIAVPIATAVTVYLNEMGLRHDDMPSGRSIDEVKS